MRAILQLHDNDINDKLLQTIKLLLTQHTEILIQPFCDLEEYDKTQPIEAVLQSLSSAGYSNAFLDDMEKGLKSSSVYSDHENKTA